MNTKKVMDLPEDMRPQEKLIKFGAETLSNAELIALIIRTGTRSENSIDVSQNLIDIGQKNSQAFNDEAETYGLKFLKNASPEELMSVPGIGVSKACMILAAIELGKRVYKKERVIKEKITSPDKLAPLIMEELRFLPEEHFFIATLNTKKEMEYLEEISVGSIDKTLVEIRDVFIKALKRNAHTIILIHNHPSGDPHPSRQDRVLTERIKKAGDILGLQVIDHIIIGDGIYFSFLEEGIF